MRLKVQHVMDATLVISQIIRDQRPLPLKGNYRLARMHAKLLPEFTLANEQKDGMIRAYNTPLMVPVLGEPDVMTPTDQFMVPADKQAEFDGAWKQIGDQEIEIDVEPIPLDQLDLGNGNTAAIQANELITLGDLVVE